jgi:hypothetical protein
LTEVNPNPNPNANPLYYIPKLLSERKKKRERERVKERKREIDRRGGWSRE